MKAAEVEKGALLYWKRYKRGTENTPYDPLCAQRTARWWQTYQQNRVPTPDPAGRAER